MTDYFKTLWGLKLSTLDAFRKKIFVRNLKTNEFFSETKLLIVIKHN